MKRVESEPNPGLWMYERDMLRCQCWCGNKRLLVPAAEIRQGRTGSCSSPTCAPVVSS